MNQHSQGYPADFSGPDFAQPALEPVDLAEPGFVLPDPLRSPYGTWPLPAALDEPASEGPDPALPNLLALERPDQLSYPAQDEALLARPEYAPEVVMDQRPAEFDPGAQTIVLGSQDEKELPPGLAYPQLYTNDNEMTRRKRHFMVLKTGLAEDTRDDH